MTIHPATEIRESIHYGGREPYPPDVIDELHGRGLTSRQIAELLLARERVVDIGFLYKGALRREYHLRANTDEVLSGLPASAETAIGENALSGTVQLEYPRPALAA